MKNSSSLDLTLITGLLMDLIMGLIMGLLMDLIMGLIMGLLMDLIGYLLFRHWLNFEKVPDWSRLCHWH